MKKALALVLCLIMVATIAVSAVSADDAALIDNRDIRAYGPQNHVYLGDEPVTGTKIPSIDAEVKDGEYTASWQFSKDDVANHTAVWNSIKSDNYMDNEWVKAYVSYGEDTLYLALVTKDPVYIVGKDGFGFNVNMKDGGTTTAAISRLCFDVWVNEDGSPKYQCRNFDKNDDGSWNSTGAIDASTFVKEIGVKYDNSTSLLTCELALSISAQLDHWGNEQELKDVAVSWAPFTYMYGPTVAGGEDVVSQGNLWGYYDGNDNPNIKLQFMLDYPEITYWHGGWFPNMIHFCKEPDPTTAPPTTTTEATTAPATTTKVTTTAPATTTVATTVAGADATTAAATTAAEKSGCGSTIALSALALVPMLGAAVVFGKKKEN